MQGHWIKQFFQSFFKTKELGALVGTGVFFLIFSLTSKRFLSIDNLFNTLTMAAELGIIAAGMCILMISGEFDLSVGAVFAVTSMVFALLINNGFDPYLALFMSLLLAVGVGFANGQITIRTYIPSFITTLGMMMFWRGILLAVSGGFPIMLRKSYPLLHYLGGRIYGGLRYSALWFLIFVLVIWFVLERTRYGNWTFATGGNLGAAKALGVPSERVKIINFMISSLFAGFSGITTLARFKIVDPTFGLEMELEAIAACVMGGTLLSGGYGSVIGTAMGAVMISMVRNGLVLAGAPAYWYRAFIGIILIIAAIINAKIRRRVVG